jgi:hypothetical protein
MVFESQLPGPWWAWGGPFLGLCVILVTAAMMVTLRAYARVKVETAALLRTCTHT